MRTRKVFVSAAAAPFFHLSDGHAYRPPEE